MDKKTEMQIAHHQGRKKMGLILAVMGGVLVLLGLADSFGLFDVPGLYGITLVIGGIAAAAKGAWDIQRAGRALSVLQG